jgi:hypothetical protein
MDKAMLAMQLVPLLMQALSENKVHLPTEAVDSFLGDGYDPGLMLDAVQNQDVGGYRDEFLGLNTAYPSDYLNPYGEVGVTDGLTPELDPEDFEYLKNTDTEGLDTLYENTSLRKPTPTAAISAFSMLNNNPNIGVPKPNIGNPEPSTTRIDGVEYDDDELDRLMDEVHQSEKWQTGENYKNPLADWYRRNKR